jgi:hypothetical protein
MKSSTLSTSGLSRSSMSGRLAMNKNGMCLVASRPRNFSKSAARPTRHFVVAENYARRGINYLEQRVCPVCTSLNVAERFQPSQSARAPEDYPPPAATYGFSSAALILCPSTERSFGGNPRSSARLTDENNVSDFHPLIESFYMS